MKKNEHHQWRINTVPGVLAVCVICDIEQVCRAFDHDLRGHVCPDDAVALVNAESALTDAHLEQPTDSILDGGCL